MARRLMLIAALACSAAAPPAARSDDATVAAQKRMALYLGDWKFSAHGDDTPFQRAGDWHGSISGYWYPGRYGVVRNNLVTGPNGATSRVMQVLYFDRAAARFHLFELTDGGFAAVENVNFTDGAMVARHDQTIGGRRWHMRWTLTVVDPTHRHYLREYSADGVIWRKCWESNETRRP